MFLPILLALSVPSYVVEKIVPDTWASVFSVDDNTFAAASDGGFQLFDRTGAKVGGVVALKTGLVGFKSRSEWLAGARIEDAGIFAFTAAGVPSPFPELSNFWRITFEAGTYLLADGNELRTVYKDDLFTVLNVGWFSLYCSSRFEHKIFVIRPDMGHVNDVVVRSVLHGYQGDGHGGFRASRARILHSPSGKEVTVISARSVSLVCIDRKHLLADCFLDGFSDRELEAAATVRWGSDTKPTGRLPGDRGICLIDVDTGVAMPIVKTYERDEPGTSMYPRDSFYDTPDERRTSLAAIGTDGTFAAVLDNGQVAIFSPTKLNSRSPTN